MESFTLRFELDFAALAAYYLLESPTAGIGGRALSDIPAFPLADRVPVISADAIARGVRAAASQLVDQLTQWGFIAIEMPGIGQATIDVTTHFAAACQSMAPSLSDFIYTQVPQRSIGGNHGFVPMFSEVPRLAKGVADPKEFLHISGAIIDDVPSGSRAVLETFNDLGRLAADLFARGFELASAVGGLICSLISDNPSLDLGLYWQSSILRLVHYVVEDHREVLAYEHSGIQMLGVQYPPSDRGLQYVLNDGQWVEPQIAGTNVVLCNVGRMLTSASGGRFRPSTHRVHRASPLDQYARWSSVLFCHPDHRANQWVIRENSRDVVPLAATWGEFVSDMVRGLGIATAAGE